MQINLYSVEVQRDEPNFSDAMTVGEFNDVRTAVDRLMAAKVTAVSSAGSTLAPCAHP